MERIQLFVETFVIFCLFLITDIRAYGYKKRYLPKALSVVLASLVLTSVNTLFYGSKNQYTFYLILLIIAGILYTMFFIDAHVIYSISLQLELICCYTVLKTTWIMLMAFTIGAPSESLFNEAIYYTLFLFSMILCSFFFSSYTLKAPAEHPFKYFVIITVIPLILLVTANLILYNQSDNNAVSFSINMFIILLLLATHYLSFLHISSYNELLEQRILSQHMDLLQSHVERSSALVDQIRRDKHEMKNVYFYINSLIEAKEYDELEEFVSTKLLHRYDRLEEFNTGYTIIDYLLSQKACEAKDSGISFLADVRLPEHLRIENNDVCSVLQNLLDNAIDASQKENEKDIHIKICQQKDYLSITVKNRCSTDVLKTNPGLKTTKSDKKSHGIGTRVIKKLVEKYDGAIDYSMSEGYFVVSILLAN